MNFKGLKNKLRRFKSIFSEHWSAFTTKYSRYNTDYYHGEIKKCLNVVVKRLVLLSINVFRVARGSTKYISAAREKLAPNVESDMRGRV